MARQISGSTSADSSAMCPTDDEDIKVSLEPAVINNQSVPPPATLPPFSHSEDDIALGNRSEDVRYWYTYYHMLFPNPTEEISNVEQLVFPPGSYRGELWVGSGSSEELDFLRMQPCVPGCTRVAEGKLSPANRKHVLGCPIRAATFEGFADPLKRLLQLASVRR